MTDAELNALTISLREIAKFVGQDSVSAANICNKCADAITALREEISKLKSGAAMMHLRSRLYVAEQERDAARAENLTLRNAAVNATEREDALRALLAEANLWVREFDDDRDDGSLYARIHAALTGKGAP